MESALPKLEKFRELVAQWGTNWDSLRTTVREALDMAITDVKRSIVGGRDTLARHESELKLTPEAVRARLNSRLECRRTLLKDYEKKRDDERVDVGEATRRFTEVNQLTLPEDPKFSEV